MDEHIRKSVGRKKKLSNLERLMRLNRSLKSLGVKFKPDPNDIPPRKVVGRGHSGD